MNLLPGDSCSGPYLARALTSPDAGGGIGPVRLRSPHARAAVLTEIVHITAAHVRSSPCLRPSVEPSEQSPVPPRRYGWPPDSTIPSVEQKARGARFPPDLGNPPGARSRPPWMTAAESRRSPNGRIMSSDGRTGSTNDRCPGNRQQQGITAPRVTTE